MVSFTHEQNTICSQKQLNDIAHEHTIICTKAFVYRSCGGMSANEKEEAFASNDNAKYCILLKPVAKMIRHCRKTCLFYHKLLLIIHL